jgi:hypothetical protein
MDFSIIYKLKNKNTRVAILTEEYVGFQRYICDNIRYIDLKIIKKNDDITFFNKGLIIFDLHLRPSVIEYEIIKLISAKTDEPIILVGHPTAEKYLLREKLDEDFDFINFEGSVE